jgi:hypothetical protein
MIRPARHALLLGLLLGCGRSEAARPPDREAPLVEPLAAGDDELAFSGELRFANAGRIAARAFRPSTFVPARAGAPGRGVELRLDSELLGALDAELGILPARAAARQEVAFGTPGQPEDPRSVWLPVALAEGETRIELPAPGEDWHAAEAVVVLEVRAGRNWLPALLGPRSEMVREGERFPGGRVVLGVIPVERRPTSVGATKLEPGTITLDGVLDEDVWQGAGTRLLASRDGEPPDELDARVGGPTLVRFAWDDAALYVAASLPDHDVFAEQREQDDPIYRNEAFELFVAADTKAERYLEFQVSARNTTFDARFPRYRKGDEAWDGQWQSAVALDGELARRGGDRGWTVELALPWAELCRETALRCSKAGPPLPGGDGRRTLRINAFRLEKPDREAQLGLALSPTLQPDFHAWANAAILQLAE